MKPEVKKPFGLQIACKIAARTLKEGKIPSSTVLYNLLSLQKELIFPKDLDESYFTKTSQAGNDLEKRLVVRLLDEMKRPQINVENILTDAVEPGWIKKKSLPAPVFEAPKKFKPKFNNNKPQKPKTDPVIIVKKSKIAL